MKSRIVFGLLSLSAVLWLSLCSANGMAAEQRPNILFIVTDDQSHRSVGCYPQAHPWVRTPHIDRLATEGVRFAPAYIGTHCIASRATLLTGRHSTGIQSLRRSADASLPDFDERGPVFWPRIFREHGYQTAHIGKWHNTGGTGYGRDWDYQKVWSRLVGGREYNLNYQSNQLISTNGDEPELTDGYSTDNYTRWACEFIRGQHREPDKPWYLWLCYDAPHGPFLPAERHHNEYADVPVPIPRDILPPRAGKPAYMQMVETWVPGEGDVPVLRASHYEADAVLRQHRDRQQFPQAYPDWVRLYHRPIRALDEGVGELLRALDETGQRERTLIVFTSDQGLAIGQHGFFDKHAPYDANLAVPLIFSMPGTLPAREVCEAPVSGVDLVPTFFRFAGIDLPWAMHGHDLTPLLHNPRSDWPHPAMLIYTINAWGDETVEIPDFPAMRIPARGFRVPWYITLRQGRYKYIRTLVEGEIEELYDLIEDPEELENLAATPEHRQRLRKYRKATLAELRRIEATFVDHLPPVGRPDTGSGHE
jgi:arylsulfatase A-like enzyme